MKITKILAALALLLPTQAFASLNSCEMLFAPMPHEVERRHEPRPNIKDDLEYLTEVQRQSNLGQIDTRFVELWDTRIFYSASSRAAKNGSLPLKNDEALGTVIFIHGSGTAKASARNFAKKMNDLTNLGYQTAGFDLPFHGHGPTKEAFNDPDHFFSWMHKIVEELRVPGKPLYLAGHSFGPHVAIEYARRYGGVDGITAFSPVAFDAVTIKWYRENASKMKFDGVVPNPLGSIWANRIMSQSLWNSQPGNPALDITALNPHLKLRFVTGDREEFVPAPTGGAKRLPIGENTYNVCRALSRLFSRFSCTTLKGMGHQILEHKDEAGVDTTLKEIVALDEKQPSDLRKMRYDVGMRVLSARDQLAQKYARDRMFARWAEENFGAQQIKNMIAAQKDNGAQAVLAKYEEILDRRKEQIFANIVATETWAPDFFEDNKAHILPLKQGKPKDETKSMLFGRYFEYLQYAPKELLKNHAVMLTVD